MLQTLLLHMLQDLFPHFGFADSPQIRRPIGSTMALSSVYTSLSSFLIEPSAIVLHPTSTPSLISNGIKDPVPSCIAGPSLCPDGPDSDPDNNGTGIDDEPSLAPMPFATLFGSHSTATVVSVTQTSRPATKSMSPKVSSLARTSSAEKPTLIPTQTLFVTMSTHIPPSTHVPAPTEDPMMHGNPEPIHPHLKPPVIFGIVIVSILACSIIPLFIFTLITKYKLRKAIAFQLGQGPRKEREWGFEGWQEQRREFEVDDGFLRAFRRRAGRMWV